jgi:hypothetical protein
MLGLFPELAEVDEVVDRKGGRQKAVKFGEPCLDICVVRCYLGCTCLQIEPLTLTVVGNCCPLRCLSGSLGLSPHRLLVPVIRRLGLRGGTPLPRMFPLDLCDDATTPCHGPSIPSSAAVTITVMQPYRY